MADIPKAEDATGGQRINTAPTKAFFVEMLVRDIALEQAVLDLIDNCIDGAKRLNADDFGGRKIDITIDSEEFRILDNCGGFSKALARDYAFRFGRPSGTPKTPNSIGQFGVGMKRALFKFGSHFVVRSATPKEEWAVDVDVNEWENDEDDWHFDWSDFERNGGISKKNPGTEVVVDDLRQEVAERFGTVHFQNEIAGLIKSKHRQFIAGGLDIEFNGIHLDATDLYFLITGALRPGVDILKFEDSKANQVTARIIAGVGSSSPREAGWYVVCNGRVILERDRRSVTGWGLAEEEQNRLIIPSYHNQFARFRGIVSFECRDASRLPWNTTKTDVDRDNPIWKETFQRMTEMMRPVIDWLNDLDRDVEEFTRDESPLLKHVSKAEQRKADTIKRKAEFKAPARGSIKKTVRTVNILYSRPVKDVEFLGDVLSVNSAKAVGERTFDIALKTHRSK